MLIIIKKIINFLKFRLILKRVNMYEILLAINNRHKNKPDKGVFPPDVYPFNLIFFNFFCSPIFSRYICQLINPQSCSPIKLCVIYVKNILKFYR